MSWCMPRRGSGPLLRRYTSNTSTCLCGLCCYLQAPIVDRYGNMAMRLFTSLYLTSASRAGWYDQSQLQHCMSSRACLADVSPGQGFVPSVFAPLRFAGHFSSHPPFLCVGASSLHVYPIREVCCRWFTTQQCWPPMGRAAIGHLRAMQK